MDAARTTYDYSSPYEIYRTKNTTTDRVTAICRSSSDMTNLFLSSEIIRYTKICEVSSNKSIYECAKRIRSVLINMREAQWMKDHPPPV